MRLVFFVFIFACFLSLPAFAITNTVFSDIDSDGDLDVYLETILQNDGGMVFTIRNLTTTSGIITIPGVTRGYFADMTGDGLEDLYIVRGGAQNFLYLRTGSGTFTNSTSTSLGVNLTGVSSASTGTAFADFDGDGDIDVYANGQFFVTIGAAFASINGTNSSNLDELPALDEVVPVDINMDGLNDFIAISSAGAVFVMLNMGDTNGDLVPEFYDSTRDIQFNGLTSINYASLADLKSGLAVNQSLSYFPFSGVAIPFVVDNFTDVYFGRTGANQLFIQLFPETNVPFSSINADTFYLPRFVNQTQSPIDDSSATTSTILADFDNNNFVDVLIGNMAGGHGIYLRNGSSWNQSYLNSTFNVSNITNFKYSAARDLDGDGFLDLAIIDAQYILDCSGTSGSSSFDTTGPPGGMSPDPGLSGFGASDLFSQLLLFSQIENIVFSNNNPFSVFIDAVEVLVQPDTGQSLVSAGVFDCDFATILADPGPSPVSVAGAGGGGGGGGYSRLNQLLYIDQVMIERGGSSYVIDDYSYRDNIRVAGDAQTSVRFDGYVLAFNRFQKAQQVLIEIGNIKQYGMTDDQGRFSILVPDLTNLQMSDQGIQLPVWFTPRLAEEPDDVRRIGNTYQPYYLENPTFNFISPYPGLGIEYPAGVAGPDEFIPGVWFNDVPVAPVKHYVPPSLPVESPSVPEKVIVPEIVPEAPVVPEVTPEVVPEKPGFFEGIFNFISDVFTNLGEWIGIVPESPPYAEPYVPEEVPDGEIPREEPGVPPAEVDKCKLVCNYQAPNALYSYVPTGNLDCKEDFKVRCGYAGETPKYEPKHGDPQAGDADSINDILDECCANVPAETVGPLPEIPKVPGAPKKGQPPIPDACIEVRTPYCAVEALWLSGSLGSKNLRPPVYAILIERIPDDAGTLECKPSWSEITDAAGAGFIECAHFTYCGSAQNFRCVPGGGAFMRDSGEVGPVCDQGASYDGTGADFPCDPCTGQSSYECGSVVDNAYFINAGGGVSMPVDAPLRDVVGAQNYDACCGSTSDALLFAQDCKTSAAQSACAYYGQYNGAGLPFFRSNTIQTIGSTCVEESSETNYEQCSCTDVLQQYGACGSAKLNANALLSYNANLVRSSCCEVLIPPCEGPFCAPSQIPVPTPIVPPPNIPSVSIPPPDVTPLAPPAPAPNINLNPPPAIDPCLPSDSSDGLQTEVATDVDGAEQAIISAVGEFPEEFVPDDYTLVESVRVNACTSQQLSFRRSISNVYNDVRVFRCQNGVCSWVIEEVNEDIACEGGSLEEIFSGDISRVLEVEQMGVVTSVGEEVTENDRLIDNGRYSVEFTGNLPQGIVSLGRPNGRITLPRNIGLVLVGTPLVITVESAPSEARITLPVTPIETATSYSVFGLMGGGWIEVGGVYDPEKGIITADVKNFDTFVSNNKAVFAVMAYSAHEKSDSCVMMKEDGNDELIVLVHGFTSNKDTWNPVVAQAKLNKEPYDIVAFQYSPDQNTDQAAQSLMSCLSTVAGNYRRYSVVGHSVGAVVVNKALDKMNQNPDAYPTVYTVEKVISLGMPNKGIDVFVMNRLADVLANYPTLATVFDRRSAIAQELVTPTWSELKAVPTWAHHIGVAGTVDCDFSQILTDVAQRPSSGAAFSIMDPVERLTRANDCVVTVKNALEHIENQELCSNTFTPNVWHIALNDDSKVRQLIFYLINSEKAKEDPTRGFAGYNQYVSWVDSCSPGTIYGIVGKEGASKKPLFCNCGDGVCDETVGETENTCPIDCFGWNMFLCTLLKNLSSLLLLLFSAGFITYVVRKHGMKKIQNDMRWKQFLWSSLGASASMLLVAAMLCPTVPVAALLLTALLGGLLIAENSLSKSQNIREPISGQKAQVRTQEKLDDWKRTYKEIKIKEAELKKYRV